MTEDDLMLEKARDVARAYEESDEYKRFKTVVAAMDKDVYIQSLVKEMKKLQAICRTKETNLLEKKETLARIESCKAKLYQTALWTNYISAKSDLERLAEEVAQSLDGILG